MRTILAVVMTMALLLPAAQASAGTPDTPYKLQRAYEVLQEEGDTDKALGLAREQLKLTPDCTEACMLICRIYRSRGEYASALSSVNDALKVNRPGKSGFSNAVLYWWKACVLGELGEADSEIAWLEKALEDARRHDRNLVRDISNCLAGRYGEAGRLDESDAIYAVMLKEDESDRKAMIGLARNVIERGDFPKAVGMLDRAERYGTDDASLYRLRSKAHDAMGNTDKAIDDALLSVGKMDDGDVTPFLYLMKKHPSYAIAKMRARLNSGTDRSTWLFALLQMYASTDMHEEAVAVLDDIEREEGRVDFIYACRAMEYADLGFFDRAVGEIDEALSMNDDHQNNMFKGYVLRSAGRYEDAIRIYDHAIELDPTDILGYYSKGWCLELLGDDGKAMECYDKGIDVDRSFAYIYLMRGEMRLKHGDRAKAEADFSKVLDLDTAATSESCRHFALAFFGMEDEAVAWMESIVEADPNDAGNMYDYCCLLCRMGRPDEAVSRLEQALRMGYCRFEQIRHDDDLDPIRDRGDFKALVERYESKLREKTSAFAAAPAPESESVTVEVPITRRSGGTFDVACQVNGLPLNMVFDTGASDVSISKVEADFMLKNSYLGRDDIKGRKYYQTADGGISEGTVITLKEVRIGDAVIRNVEASVVKSQKAPLLLGQSVLERFGTFTVDNINSKLLIRQRRM